MIPVFLDRPSSDLDPITRCGNVIKASPDSETDAVGLRGRCYRYAHVDTDVGRLLVVMSHDGVVDIIRGESEGEVLRTAVAHYPSECFIPDEGSHADWVSRAVERFRQPAAGIDGLAHLGSAWEDGRAN